MNKYEFEHPMQNRGKIVRASSFYDADGIVKAEDPNGDSWNLIRAWDSDGKKTWDAWLGLCDLPPAKFI